jgi:hypothetical protein
MEREHSCRVFYREILGSITEQLSAKYNEHFTYHVSHTYRMKEYHSHIVFIRRIIQTNKKPQILEKSIQLYFYSNRVEFYTSANDMFVIPMKEYNIAILERIYYNYFL